VRYSVGSFAIVPKPLAVYRITPGSLSSNAIRYFTVRTSMVEIRCLYGTAGVSRYFWRRRYSPSCITTRRSHCARRGRSLIFNSSLGALRLAVSMERDADDEV